MPSLTFVLPHWLYWSGLILFPLLGMVTVRRQKRTGASGGISLSISYMLWLTGGFVGLHRFYLRSRLGALYIPLFIAILYGNVLGRHARDAVSEARNALLNARFNVERTQSVFSKGSENGAAELAEAKRQLASTEERLVVATTDFEFWQSFSGSFALAIVALLLIDAFLLPRLTRRCADRERGSWAADPTAVEKSDRQPGRGGDPSSGLESRFATAVGTLNGWIGHFVCYWSVIAVFVYYYEVLARYVFNSPTNWAHESMFLMFGMQYLISGGFAYREDAHVRVDVIYSWFSRRGRALLDIFTSFFFFLFTGALLWTGWNFMMDSINVWEVSFTEWAIQYWPVKSTIAAGALLILLQGLAKLIKDIHILMAGEI